MGVRQETGDNEGAGEATPGLSEELVAIERRANIPISAPNAAAKLPSGPILAGEMLSDELLDKVPDSAMSNVLRDLIRRPTTAPPPTPPPPPADQQWPGRPIRAWREEDLEQRELQDALILAQHYDVEAPPGFPPYLPPQPGGAM